MKKQHDPVNERLTVLVGQDDIKRIKYLAIDRGVSASEIVRTAVKDYFTCEAGTRFRNFTEGATE
jgi:uncharacterized protein YpmB